jgi:hypothetical protein
MPPLRLMLLPRLTLLLRPLRLTLLLRLKRRSNPSSASMKKSRLMPAFFCLRDRKLL